MYAFSFISIYFFFPPSYFCYFRISIAKLFHTMYDTLGKILADLWKDFLSDSSFQEFFFVEHSFIMLKAFYLLYDWIMLWAFGMLKDQLLGNFTFFVCKFEEIVVVKAFLGIWGFKCVCWMILSTGYVEWVIFFCNYTTTYLF